MEQREIFKVLKSIIKERRMKVYLVGGAVRDKILKLPSPPDLDFVIVEGSASDLSQELARRFPCHHPLFFPDSAPRN